MTKSMQHKVDRARKRACDLVPFFAAALSSIRDVQVSQRKCPTLMTDGTTIFWCREWIDEHDDELCALAILHEFLHIERGHVARSTPYNDDLRGWNYACDFEVNYVISETVGRRVPEDWLYDERYAGMCAESIYEILKREDKLPKPDTMRQQGDEGESCDTFGVGQGHDMSEKITAIARMEAEATTESVRQLVKEALAQASGRVDYDVPDFSDIPHDVQKQVSKALGCGTSLDALSLIEMDYKRHHDVPWRTELLEWFDSKFEKERSFKRRNRRSAARGLIQPGNRKCGIDCVVFAIDVSSSVDTELCQTMAEHISDVAGALDIEKVVIITCAAAVYEVFEFERGDTVILDSFKHGGGTDFTPVFEKVEEMDLSPSGLVYLSDMEVSVHAYGDEPGYPVLWASYADSKKYLEVPYGSVVEIHKALR